MTLGCSAIFAVTPSVSMPGILTLPPAIYDVAPRAMVPAADILEGRATEHVTPKIRVPAPCHEPGAICHLMPRLHVLPANTNRRRATDVMTPNRSLPAAVVAGPKQA